MARDVRRISALNLPSALPRLTEFYPSSVAASLAHGHMLQIKTMIQSNRNYFFVWIFWLSAVQWVAWNGGEANAQLNIGHPPAKASAPQFVGRVEQAIDHAREACRAAKSESELNKVLLDLFRLKEELGSQPSDAKMEGLIRRMELTLEAVNSYQDMLAFRAAGYEKQAEKLHQQVTEFVEKRENFTSARNVQAVLNSDGSPDVTWENIPGDDEEINLRYENKDGEWVTMATLPAGTTSYHQPPDPPAPQK